MLAPDGLREQRWNSQRRVGCASQVASALGVKLFAGDPSITAHANHSAHTPFSAATFDHHFARHLPGEAGAVMPRQVQAACWSVAPPTPVTAPNLLAWSEDLAGTLGLTVADQPQHVAEVLAGNRLLPA